MDTIKIWGVRAGLIGDTVMSLPSLRYLKKTNQNSHVTWVIHRKNSQAAPIYINHPDIDKIYVTEGWQSLTQKDLEIKNQCNIQINEAPPARSDCHFNHMGCVEIVSKMAGIENLSEVLTEDERVPRLNKWWVNPTDQHQESNHGYSQVESRVSIPPTIGIFPFAHYGTVPRRSPSIDWWQAVCIPLQKEGYKVRHFGWITEPNIFGVEEKMTHLSYFEQIKHALECDIVIGTDSGSMWVIGAYEKKAIHIMTYHMAGHNENPLALEPVNKLGYTFFNPDSCSNVDPRKVVERILS